VVLTSSGRQTPKSIMWGEGRIGMGNSDLGEERRGGVPITTLHHLKVGSHAKAEPRAGNVPGPKGGGVAGTVEVYGRIARRKEDPTVTFIWGEKRVVISSASSGKWRVKRRKF